MQFKQFVYSFCLLLDVLHYKMDQAGFLAALPYLLMACIVQSAGVLADLARTRGRLSTTQVSNSISSLTRLFIFGFNANCMGIYGMNGHNLYYLLGSQALYMRLISMPDIIHDVDRCFNETWMGNNLHIIISRMWRICLGRIFD